MIIELKQDVMREIKPTRKSSIVYFQIGLIVALLLSIFVIENKSEMEILTHETARVHELKSEKAFVFHMPKKKPEKTLVKKEKKPSKKLPVKATKKPVLEPSVFESNEPTKSVKKDLGEIDLEKPMDEKIEEFSYTVVEMVPVFPGCEVYKSQAEIRACFSSQIAKMIKKKFDSNLAAELNLNGEQRIYVNFTVNELGFVENVKVKSLSEELANEAKRVVKLLPQMKPAQQQNKEVSVNYSLPIIFHIR